MCGTARIVTALAEASAGSQQADAHFTVTTERWDFLALQLNLFNLERMTPRSSFLFFALGRKHLLLPEVPV